MVKPYQKGDYAKLRIRAGDDWGAFSESIVSRGTAYTIWEDGAPVACGGFVYNLPGVYSCWCAVTDTLRGRGMAFTRLVKRRMDEMMKRPDVHRLQAQVRVDKLEYYRWAQLFGMKGEGIMHKATHDQVDVYMVARVE